MFDKVTVYDKSADRNNEIGKFCGRNIPAKIESSENLLVVLFETDDSRNGEGFTANIEFVIACKFILMFHFTVFIFFISKYLMN